MHTSEFIGGVEKWFKYNPGLCFCFPAVELDPHYVRALLRRAELYEKTEKLDEALEDYKAVLEKDPSVHQAREACMVSLSLSVNFGLTYLSLF